MTDEEKAALQAIAKGHRPVMTWEGWSWPEDPYDASMAVWERIAERVGVDRTTIDRADTGDEQDFIAELLTDDYGDCESAEAMLKEYEGGNGLFDH